MLGTSGTSSYDELVRIIRYVRNRWRTRVLLRGAAIVVAAGLVFFAVSAWGMDHFRYTGWAVLLFRILSYVALGGLALRYLILPLTRRVSDEQVALYIEEHDRSLQEALISAVEMAPKAEEKDTGHLSPALIKRLMESAVARCESIDYGHRIESQSLRRASGLLASSAIACMIAVLLSPGFLRHGASLLLNPFRSARADSPYAIQVEPGNVAVARGADQMIVARLDGFDSDRVEIAMKSPERDWERWPMSIDETNGSFGYMMFDIRAGTDYFVEASGVRSSLFHIDVTDLPYVRTIDLEYHFPDYTGLEPRLVEDGGDIAALKGTRVDLTVTPTVRVSGGVLQVEQQEPIPLSPREDGTLVGSLEVMQDGYYNIELSALDDGNMTSASTDYVIEVLSDQPPSISISKPGRDTKVSPIEEVFAEIKAEDDYGLQKIELIFSVNGGQEQTVDLFHSGNGSKKELTAGHTFFLEDFELRPGDFVSYYARATDTDAVEGFQSATTDIYFIEARPFGKNYRQAQQGMSGAGGQMDGALSLRQRQIIAATFKLIRDKDTYSPKDYQENLTTVALMQGRLREQVANLLRRMSNRGIADQSDDFGSIAESLRQAVEEMTPAEERLSEYKPDEALPPEQRALQHLQRAEATFRDVQVAFGAAGGGGGGEQANAEDLADLFELELDKLRNQYETVERGERQSADNQVDEALQRLQELARRQQQENERMKRRQFQNMGGGGGGGGQRELADEAEELARKLERLAREQSRPDLMETARRLEQAANSMRRAAGGGSDSSLSQGIAALDRLKDARRLLEKNRSVRLERDIKDAMERAQRLVSQQEKVRQDVGQLGQDSPGADRERMERLMERKDELASEIADLESQLDRMARESRGEEKDASRKLQESSNWIRDSKLKEKVRYSKGVVQGRSPEYAQRFEEQIQSDIEGVQERLRQAAGSLGQSQESEVAEALEKTRELVRNLESVGDRVREHQRGLGERGSQDGSEGGQQEGESRDPSDGSASSNEGGQQGREGQEGQRGQPGQQAAQGSTAGGNINGPGFVGAGTNVGSFQPGQFSSEDIRQFRSEFRERLREAEELRQDLRRQDLQVPDLQSIIEKMRAFDERGIYLNPLGFEELQAALVDELKQFEYWLRRELEGLSEDKLYLSRSDQVPNEYRKLVEEYYRTLSEGPGN